MSGALQPVPTLELFEHIAEQYASGVPLYRISEAFEFVPGPMVLRRWQREFPAFAALLRDAADVRAERLVEEALEVADDETRSASHARNAIGVRERLADRISAPGAGENANPVSGNPSSGDPEELTTEELFRLLNDKVPAIELSASEYTNKSSGEEGGTPPHGETAPVSERVPGTSPPRTKSLETSHEQDYANGSSGVVDDGAAGAKLALAGEEGDTGEDGVDWVDDVLSGS